MIGSRFLLQQFVPHSFRDPKKPIKDQMTNEEEAKLLLKEEGVKALITQALLCQAQSSFPQA
jgi:hypothetical protein